MTQEALYKAIERAVTKALDEVGVSGLKKTSLFMSNSIERRYIKLAA